MNTEKIRRIVAALFNQPIYRVTDEQELVYLIAEGSTMEQALARLEELIGIRFVHADGKELVFVRDLIGLLRLEMGGAPEVDFSEPSFQAMYEIAFGHSLPVQDAA
jgi:hypothetical protein